MKKNMQQMTEEVRQRKPGIFHRTMTGVLTAVMVSSSLAPAIPVLADEQEAVCNLQFGAAGIANPTPWAEGAISWDGDYVYLGQYQQTLNEDTGEFLVEPIKWRVLDPDSSANLDDKEANDAIYLVTDKVIDATPYNSVFPPVTTWEGSEVKAWLNSEFLESAFSEGEQSALAVTSGEGELFDIFSSGVTEVRGDVGNVKAFLPTASDMMNPIYGYKTDPRGDSTRIVYATDYTAYRGASLTDGVASPMLRSVNSGTRQTFNFGNTGDIGAGGTRSPQALAPAVQLIKSQVIFSEPAGEEEGTWELTLADNSQELTVTLATYKGNTATIAFEGATTGEGQQVSAIITDSEENQIISCEQVADTSESAEGSGSITLPEGFAENGYKLYVFPEQEQEGVLPDYAGELQEVTLTKSESKVEGISLDKTSMNFFEKWEKQRLTAVLDPADADNQNVTWTTNNEQVARVTEKGLVMAVNDGTATITVTSEDGNKTASCKVTVKGTKPDITTLDKVQRWGFNALKITWAKGYNVDGYRIYRATSKNGIYQYVTQIANGNTTSYVNSGLTTGTTYYYKVRAYRTVNGEKVFGGMSEVKDAMPVPTTVKITKGTAGSKQAKLTWNRVNGASGYRVYYKTSKNGTWKYVTQLGKGTTTSYTHKGLKSGSTFYYKMRAYRTVNGNKVFGAYSAEMAVKAK